MSSARAWTRTSWFRDKRINWKATTSPWSVHKAGLKTQRSFLLLRLVSRGRGNSLIQRYPTSWIPLWFTLALQSFFSRKHSTVWSEVKLILCSQYTPSQQIRVKWSWKWLNVTVDFCLPIVANYICCLNQSLNFLVHEKRKQFRKLLNLKQLRQCN